MTKSRKTRCKKEKNKKNSEVLELLNDENQKKEMNEEVTKKKDLKLRIVFMREKLKRKLANETDSKRSF